MGREGLAKGFDLSLRMELYAHRVWRACTCGAVINEHSPVAATGTAWERTPWHATQRAAWSPRRRCCYPSFQGPPAID
jgi:hypothetical protein